MVEKNDVTAEMLVAAHDRFSVLDGVSNDDLVTVLAATVTLRRAAPSSGAERLAAVSSLWKLRGLFISEWGDPEAWAEFEKAVVVLDKPTPSSGEAVAVKPRPSVLEIARETAIEARRRINEGQLDLRDVGKLLTGKWDQDAPAALLDTAFATPSATREAVLEEAAREAEKYISPVFGNEGRQAETRRWNSTYERIARKIRALSDHPHAEPASDARVGALKEAAQLADNLDDHGDGGAYSAKVAIARKIRALSDHPHASDEFRVAAWQWSLHGQWFGVEVGEVGNAEAYARSMAKSTGGKVRAVYVLDHPRADSAFDITDALAKIDAAQRRGAEIGNTIAEDVSDDGFDAFASLEGVASAFDWEGMTESAKIIRDAVAALRAAAQRARP